MRRTSVAIALLAAGLTLAVVGCGGDGSGGGYGSNGGSSEETNTASGYGGGANTATSTVSGPAVVSVGTVPGLGQILVDARGHTLYDFHKDRGTKSACYGACAGVWPPLTSDGAPQAKGGASTSKLGTSKRTDGTMQVTYAGHPLYTYATDTKPGDAKGNDIDSFGAEWYALTPNGAEPED